MDTAEQTTYTLAEIRESGMGVTWHPDGFTHFRGRDMDTDLVVYSICRGIGSGPTVSDADTPPDGWLHVVGCSCRDCVGDAEHERRAAEYEAQVSAYDQLWADSDAGLPTSPELVSIACSGPSVRIAEETFMNFCPREYEAAAEQAAGPDCIGVACIPKFPAESAGSQDVTP